MPESLTRRHPTEPKKDLTPSKNLNNYYRITYLPAPIVLYRKFQQETKEEIPQEVLYWGRLIQYLKNIHQHSHAKLVFVIDLH